MNYKNKIHLLLITLSIFIFGIALLTTSRIFVLKNSAFAQSNSKSVNNIIDPDDENYFKFFPMFKRTYYILKKEFVDRQKVTAKNLFYGAIKGMLNALGDPYSTFMDPTIAKEFDIDMSAKFGGLGIHIDIRDGWLTVISPIEDTPAWKKGLKPNDKIIEIEGVSTAGISVLEAVAKLRGKPGTAVTITILRQGIEEPFKVTIVREEIIIKTVKSDIIPYKTRKYGYIRINEFSMPTADEFKKHLLEALNKKPDGLIVDLRGNPGGLLNIVVKCVDFFLDKGLIVYTRGRLSENNADYLARKENTIVPDNLPLVVLIDQGSASASEIFAGAIQDTGRGVLVGLKSFGKGSVQKTFEFPEDKSLIKYTVAKYYTPAGKVIDQVGLQPDIEQKNWYDKLNDDEKSDIFKLQATNFIKNFVDSHTKISESVLLEFRQQLVEKNYNISLKSLKWLVEQKIKESQMPELYNLEWDEQLVKSIDVLENYKHYNKKLTYYESAN